MRISRGLLDRLLAGARRVDGDAAQPPERCGLLFGTGQQIEGFQSVANVHPQPARHFELDPAALIAATRAARGDGPAIIGHYHSHPAGGAPEPSAADAAAADADGRLWLIITPDAAALWRAVPGGAHRGAFTPVAISID